MSQPLSLGILPYSQKQNHPQSPTRDKQLRKLRVQLSDRVFQLKKMQQDFAQQKAHFLMQFNHEKNTLNLVIRELRTKISQQNQHWVQKYRKLQEQNEQATRQINNGWKSRISNEVNKQVQQIKCRYENEIKQLKQKITKLTEQLAASTKKHEKNILELKESWNGRIQEIQQLKQAEIQQLKDKMIRDEEIKINAIMSIKNSQQKQHTQTKNILLRREIQYGDNLKRLQERVFELNQQTWSLKKKVQSLSQINNQQSCIISKFEQSKISSVKTTSQQYEQKLQRNQQQWKQNLESLNQKWKNQYKKVQVAYQRISSAFEQKQRLWQERGNKVLKLFQMRQARQQDVKLIEHLEVQLIKKQFELQRQKQELKCCKLELDNMDDIYKRIFHSVKKNNRHSNSFHLKKMRLPGIGNKSTHPVKDSY